jgi:hypothetical protein
MYVFPSISSMTTSLEKGYTPYQEWSDNLDFLGVPGDLQRYRHR